MLSIHANVGATSKTGTRKILYSARCVVALRVFDNFLCSYVGGEGGWKCLLHFDWVVSHTLN